MRGGAVPAFFVALGFGFAVAGAEEARGTLIPFEIKDQFDQVHTNAGLESHPVLVLCGDRKGSQYQGLWADAIRDSLRAGDRLDGVRILDVADVRGVPFFIKGSVKKKFPQDRDSPVLLDWKGRFAKAYSFEADRLNVVLFDRDGKLVYRRAVDEVDPEELGALLGWIDRVIPG